MRAAHLPNFLRDRHAPLALALVVGILALSRPVLFRDVSAEDKKDDKEKQIAQLGKDLKSATTLRAKGAIIDKLSMLGEGAARPLCDAMTDKDIKGQLPPA